MYDVIMSDKPNLDYPDPAVMQIWPDWRVMMYAANCLEWPKHAQLVLELRKRAELERDGSSVGFW